MSEDNTKPKTISIKDPIKLEDQNTFIIQQTVEKTMAALLPLLQKNSAVNLDDKTTQNVRTDIVRQINKAFDKRLESNRKFMARLASAPEKEFTKIKIPRVYAQYFGPMLPVGINGSLINIPIDNKYHKVHKIYVPIIEQTLEYEDEKISFMQRTGKNDTREVTQGSLGH
jgi:hypothetical protein